jgi:hypothetical protein
MNKITFPLKHGPQGPAVVDLQDVLQLYLHRSAILDNDEVARRELSAALKRERAKQIYGDATGTLVSIFQEERRLQSSGEVDDATASRLNDLLRELGALDNGPPVPERIVARQEVSSTRQPLPSVAVTETRDEAARYGNLGSIEVRSQGGDLESAGLAKKGIW